VIILDKKQLQKAKF